MRKQLQLEQEMTEDRVVKSLEARRSLGDRLQRLLNTKGFDLVFECLDIFQDDIKNEIAYKAETLEDLYFHRGRLKGIEEVRTRFNAVINDAKLADMKLKTKG